MSELKHHGILGQNWGIRRYQNKDGTLTSAGRKHLAKQDTKWAKKNADKITKTVKAEHQSELNAYGKELLRNPNARTSTGKLSAATVNAYNRKMADLMNTTASRYTSPSGKVVQFVAKRGEMGVMMALADNGYDMTQLKNGVWTDGRVAYKKNSLGKIEV